LFDIRYSSSFFFFTFDIRYSLFITACSIFLFGSGLPGPDV
jgi:hypothetical protein